jgi:parallel beta-helix repeat protein
LYRNKPSVWGIERAQYLLLRLAVIILLAGAGLARAGNFYHGITPASVPWPGGMVPYDFSNAVTAAEQQTYLNGLREWELAANVKFVPHTTQPNWIRFCYNTNFQDYVLGGSYSPQIVTVSSLGRAQVCHEMGHSFGFTHENIRPDATNYVLLLTNNISNEASNIYWFTIDPTSVTNGAYDYESVMHLGWDFDSTNPGVTATQQPKPPNFPKYQYRMGNYCLSPGDRAALAYLYGAPMVPLSNLVTNTADTGLGSLRAALYYVTDHPGSVVTFNIPTSDPGYSNGVYNIHLTGMLPPLVANGMVIDGSTQPGYAGKPLIVLDGSQILPETFTSDTGLLVYSASNQVKDVSFSGFIWNGLTFEYPNATNNTVSGCWIGADATGTNAAPNAFQGILVTSGASHNTFGSSNVISGNAQYGVYITGSNTVGNVVAGNYIGVNANGSGALSNDISGVFIGGLTSGNIVGGTNVSARNVLSGNFEYGVWLSDTNTTQNIVEGNYIGIDKSGSNGIPNGASGIFIGNGTSSNTIGGVSAGAGNVISGNSAYGIYMTNTTANAISGNIIGMNAGGETALGNVASGIGIFGGVSNNIIGGARNVISGNSDYGIEISGIGGVMNNLVSGNYLGTDAAGTNSPGIQQFGVGIFGGATGNTVGGTAVGAGNLISGNTSYGIYVSDAGTSNNFVEGNLIGTDKTGTNAIPNVDFGIGVWSGASGNVIGGTAAGARNVVSGTIGAGYGITLGGANRNVVEGNYIGTDISGTEAIPNHFAGVAMYDNGTGGAVGNLIGGTNAGAGNVIADNYGPGVVLYNNDTTNNSIRGNSIFGNDGLGVNFNNDGPTPNHTGFMAGPNDLQNYPVITNTFGLGGGTIVEGSFNSLPNGTYSLDFYRNINEDFSGYGQGQVYLGGVSVTTSGSGNASFAYTNWSGNYSGQYISATATAATGDSSEFSADMLATNLPAPFAQFGGSYRWLASGFVFNLTFETNFSYHIQVATNLAVNPIQWVNLTNFTATNVSLLFTDRTAAGFRARFYRVISP